MQKWLFNSEGIDFKFNNFNINFKGNLKVCYINKIQNNILPKIFSIELDFEPLIPQEMVHLLLEIENYLKSADSIFFMSYFINTDFEILNNDLSHSISSVMRQVKMKRRKDESNQE